MTRHKRISDLLADPKTAQCVTVQVAVDDLRALLADAITQEAKAAETRYTLEPTAHIDAEDLENQVVNEHGALIASPWYDPEDGFRARRYYDDLAGCVSKDGWYAVSCMGNKANELRGQETGKEGERLVDEALTAWGVDIGKTNVWWFSFYARKAGT